MSQSLTDKRVDNEQDGRGEKEGIGPELGRSVKRKEHLSLEML